jgi:uncharacterized cupredoxin-like copper-binding protein
MRKLVTVGLVVAMAVALAGSVACNSSKKSSPVATQTEVKATATGSGAISAKLVEYGIHLSSAPTKAGDVTFNVQNIGATTHEVVVLRTDSAANALPKKPDGSADEVGQGVTNVGETDDMDAGTTKDLTVDLQPGHYVLICNVVQSVTGQTISHYQKGMYTEFDITQ